MDGFDPAASFGPAVAAHYDDALRGDELAAVQFLAERAGVGPALEFAIRNRPNRSSARRHRITGRRDRAVTGHACCTAFPAGRR